MSKNFMVDLETLGRTQNAVIAQIACVEFEPRTGKIYREFSVNVDIEDCQQKGLQIDASMVLWWFDQSTEAKQSVFFQPSEKLEAALTKFWSFIGDDKKENILWANSPSFDLEILKNAFRKVKTLNEVWIHKNERDFRTISQLFPQIQKGHIRKGTAHSALDDCRNQVAILHKCWKMIR